MFRLTFPSNVKQMFRLLRLQTNTLFFFLFEGFFSSSLNLFPDDSCCQDNSFIGKKTCVRWRCIVDFGQFGFSSCLCSVVCFIEKRVAVSLKRRLKNFGYRLLSHFRSQVFVVKSSPCLRTLFRMKCYAESLGFTICKSWCCHWQINFGGLMKY